MLRNIEQYGQSATRLPARPGHMEGTCQLRGWVENSAALWAPCVTRLRLRVVMVM